MAKWLFLLGAIVSEVAATLSLKAALSEPAFYAAVVAGYITSFVLLAAALRNGLTIGVAYGIWGAGGVTLTALLAAAIFGEPLTAVMGLGMACIIIGVLTVELGAQSAHLGRGQHGAGGAT